MKNTLFTILIAANLLVACSPEDDQDTTTTPSPTPSESVPASPTTLGASQIGNSQVLLTWKDNAGNESGFYIERKTGSEAFVKIDSTGNNVATYTDTGLVANTEYTYRVIAYNAIGNSVAYSNEVSQKMYVYVTIGTTSWMQQNLDVEHYRNGDMIPEVKNITEWANLTTGAWCYYANQTANGIVYGKLYNWYAVNDPRGLAPQGWHVATDDEWTALTTELGGISVAGGPMKSLEYWTSPNSGATNSSGFSAVGGGARLANGTFTSLGAWGSWWTATKDTEGIAFYRILYNNNTRSEGYHNVYTLGLSVRCVKD